MLLTLFPPARSFCYHLLSFCSIFHVLLMPKPSRCISISWFLSSPHLSSLITLSLVSVILHMSGILLTLPIFVQSLTAHHYLSGIWMLSSWRCLKLLILPLFSFSRKTKVCIYNYFQKNISNPNLLLSLRQIYYIIFLTSVLGWIKNNHFKTSELQSPSSDLLFIFWSFRKLNKSPH